MNFRKFVRSFFIKKDGEKDVLDRKRVFICIGLLVGIGSMSVIFFGENNDSSVIAQSSTPIEHDQAKKGDSSSKDLQASNKVNGLLNSSESIGEKPNNRNQRRVFPRRTLNIEYKATQVIERKGPSGLSKGLPLGTNLIGKLLTSIDTRETGQYYKVLLPYGGKGKNGGSLPKNTIAFGKISYSGKGKKVFISFTKALLPDGREVKMKAQALNSKSYSPGLVGDFHGKRTERIVSTLGLTMVSAMTDTLTEREALGGQPGSGGMVATELTPKATAKNALYQGISKVSEMEAQRQASELGNQQEYVTIPAGTELIVSLVSTYYGDQ